MTAELHDYFEYDQEQRDELMRQLAAVSLRPFNEALMEQIAQEVWYNDAIRIEPAEYNASVSPAEVQWRMEVDHTVKQAPLFREQLFDTSRTNLIRGQRRNQLQSEQQALHELDEYLAQVDFTSDFHRNYTSQVSEIADDLRTNLTFIGEKEYQEAAAGLATYWQRLLDNNPEQQLYVATGRIQAGRAGMIKSDSYLLDTILGQFSDEQLRAWTGRLITREQDITATTVDDITVVLLDDWVLSGQQLVGAAESFMDDYPELANAVEVQLVAATEQRLKSGLIGKEFGFDGSSRRESLPLRAYYTAHGTSLAQDSGAHITGAHASTDYDFQDDLLHIDRVRERYQLPHVDLPLLADVARPYRQPTAQLAHLRHYQMLRQGDA